MFINSNFDLHNKGYAGYVIKLKNIVKIISKYIVIAINFSLL